MCLYLYDINLRHFFRETEKDFVEFGIYSWKINWLGIFSFWSGICIIHNSSLYFLYINYFSWVSITLYAFCYSLLEKQLGTPEKIIGTPKSSLSFTLFLTYLIQLIWWKKEAFVLLKYYTFICLQYKSYACRWCLRVWID